MDFHRETLPTLKKGIPMHRALATAVVVFGFAAFAQATTLFTVERTCPIGGAKYPSVEIGSTSQFGMRLDLRPNGPAAHLPWVKCPNGFIHLS